MESATAKTIQNVLVNPAVNRKNLYNLFISLDNMKLLTTTCGLEDSICLIRSWASKFVFISRGLGHQQFDSDDIVRSCEEVERLAINDKSSFFSQP